MIVMTRKTSQEFCSRVHTGRYLVANTQLGRRDGKRLDNKLNNKTVLVAFRPS